MIPLLTALASSGLNILAGAIKAKGKEFIEKKLGVSIPDSGNLSPDQIAKLKELEMQHEEFLINMQIKQKEMELEADKVASVQVTDRWKADMASDSWLSKNIRPMTLIFILSVYTIFALLSAFDVDINTAYVELLGQWGMLIMSAYFVGRTVEKGLLVIKKETSNEPGARSS